jgi:hypothetical protein
LAVLLRETAERAVEASELLGCHPIWLYENTRDLPFAYRHGKRGWRFSYLGVQAYIARERGPPKCESQNLSAVTRLTSFLNMGNQLGPLDNSRTWL